MSAMKKVIWLKAYMPKKSFSRKLSILNKSVFFLESHFAASKYQKLRKTKMFSIKTLKDTYLYCVIGYIKCYMNKKSNQYTMVLLQINGFYIFEIA